MNILEYADAFYAKYGGEKGVIGKSENGKPLYYFRAGDGEKKIIVQCACHAREYVTAYLAFRLIKRQRFQKRASVYFVPLLNPDGVEIVISGNPLYKANARGVDLNVNFDAKWGTGATNAFEKGAENFVGEKPFSETETRAIRDFTLQLQPNATLSFHSKGEEIYWYFNQKGYAARRDERIALALAKSTGYAVKLTPGSAGGYKDWCVEKLGIPAFTLEVGKEKRRHPLTLKDLPGIYRRNKNVIGALIREL